MKLIAFVLINFTCEIISSKLPLSSFSEIENTNSVLDDSSTIQQSNADSLNTRDITDYGSYMPTDYGNLNFVSSWVDSISRMLPTYTQPEPYYNTQTYYPFSTDYSQEQWSSQLWPYDWSQYNSNSFPNQLLYTNTVNSPHLVGTQNPSYYVDPYQPQPAVTKKISTVFNTGDSQEIKHKLVISPEFPDGTGYISIRPQGADKNSGGTSQDGKVYYRF